MPSLPVTLTLCLLLIVHQSVSQLTSEQQQLLLDLHNQARSDAAPIATNMEEMQWNDELAGVAQTYSARCVFEHNPNRGSQAPSFRSVGENLAISSGRGLAYEFLFTLWHDERHDYTYNTNACDPGAVCGHYTQVVWATSNQLGCGATLCPTVPGFGGTNALNLVCNYGPAGNFRGRLPYMTGASSCSNCPDDKRSCVNNLCSNTTIVDPTSSTAMTTSGNPTATNMATPTPAGGDMDGSSCKIYQSMLLVLTLALLSLH